jgi:uncharacterized damage-inducible protein DinB
MTLSPEQAQGLAMFLIQTIENEIPNTKKVLSAVPQDKLGFKLGEKGRTAQELMWHIVEADIWFAEGVAAGEFAQSDSKGPAPETVEEIVSRYESGIGVGVAKLKALTGAQLAKPINFYNIMNLPAVMYLGFLNNHSIHHRGQLAAYLRAMNAHVPSIYGGSADEPFQMAAEG